MTTSWTHLTNNTASTASANYVVTRPTTISIAPIAPAVKTPLAWLREQVEEICQLARDP
jgi:hypothetical protein